MSAFECGRSGSLQVSDDWDNGLDSKLSPDDPSALHLSVSTVDKYRVTPFTAPSYNVQLMSTAADGPEESQFAPARVLAALSSVPTALSGGAAFAFAPQPVR